MNLPGDLYKPSLALLTDLYQITMACAYWRSGLTKHEAVFHLTHRRHPFRSGFTVAAGLAAAAEYLEGLRFRDDDLAYLAGLNGTDGEPLFDGGFLDHLGALRFRCDVDGVPEGTVVFPNEPLLRVRGPVLQAQLLETPLLNLMQFPTLIATKAARLRLAAGGDELLEFGLRRAQGIDGALTASRAAYLGGCDATSSVLAGKLFGIPVRGTHAHSWVMLFDDELAAFREYAAALPNNVVFLVDTYDTLDGVRNAVEAARELRAAGYKLAGIRLDSGDLAYLAIEARKMLDEAGFEDAKIVASNDLDESVIGSLKGQGAPIAVWGVGTRLVTGHGDPALGAVYKLSAVRAPGGEWQDRIKLSEQAVKVSTPGILQVRRFRLDGEYAGDLIFDERLGAPAEPTIVDPLDGTRRKEIPAGAGHEDLLVPVFRGGKRVWNPPSLADARARREEQLARFHAGIKRFLNPHEYPVGYEARLHERKTRLILEARARTRSAAEDAG